MGHSIKEFSPLALNVITYIFVLLNIIIHFLFDSLVLCLIFLSCFTKEYANISKFCFPSLVILQVVVIEIKRLIADLLTVT